MKRRAKSIFLSFLLLPVLFLFGACDKKTQPNNYDDIDSRVVLTSSHVELSNTLYDYDGTEHRPAVTVNVNHQPIDASNYNVTYKDNVQIGTASVTVKAVKASELIRGEITKEFQIVAHYDSVSSATDLTNALRTAQPNVTKFIKLGQDITSATPIEVSFTRRADIVLDLNNKKIEQTLTLKKEMNNTAVAIKMTNGTIGSATAVDGLYLEGQNLNVELDGVTLLGSMDGLKTNGLVRNQTIKATNCTFGVNAEQGDASTTTIAGAYLPAGGTYTFDGCTFNGLTAYATKSGTHTLTDCEFTASKAYQNPNKNNNGGLATTGSAIMVECNADYGTAPSLTIEGGNLKSAHGYAIEQYNATNSTETATISVDGARVCCEEKNGAVYTENETEVEGLETCYYDVYCLEALQNAINWGKITNIVLQEDVGDETLSDDNIVVFANNTNLQSRGTDAAILLNLDLNNKTIYGSIYLQNKDDETEETLAVDVTIKNGKVVNKVGSQTHYAISMIGDTNLKLTLENVEASGDYAGLTVSGKYAGSKLYANECSFIGENAEGVGAYLAAGQTHEFTKCKLEGYTALYLKGGDTKLDDCTLTANGAARDAASTADGFEATGSAIVIESRNDYPESAIKLYVKVGTIKSTHNYAIEEFAAEGVTPKVTEIKLEGAVKVINSNDNHFKTSEGVTVSAPSAYYEKP